MERKCAKCGKSDYTEGIDFEDMSFCRNCCEESGMGNKSAKAKGIGFLRQFISESSKETFTKAEILKAIEIFSEPGSEIIVKNYINKWIKKTL